MGDGQTPWNPLREFDPMEPTLLRWIVQGIQTNTARRFGWSSHPSVDTTGSHPRRGKVSGGHPEIGGRPEGRSRFSDVRRVPSSGPFRSVFRCAVGGFELKPCDGCSRPPWEDTRMTPFLGFRIATAFPGPEGVRCDGVPVPPGHWNGCWPTRAWA